MHSRPIPRNQRTAASSNEWKPESFGRSSFRVQRHTSDSSLTTKVSPKYAFTNSVSIMESSLRESSISDEKHFRDQGGKSSGLYYSASSSKELSSIDRINDPSSNSIVCAGKTHLGLYKFSPQDKSIKCVHDFMYANDGNRGSSSLHLGLSKRPKRAKLSTIADVKAGFHNHRNYVAICSDPTVISIYDINKTNTIDNPLVTSCSQHVRSVNSFDFNMVQTNLIISGGQDSSIKIWDLRSSRGRNLSRSDININTGSASVRDVKWMPYLTTGRQPSSNDLRGANISGAPGYNFASIHDSGLLLKFDLRQPSQAEKRINAHSGPGLCLNWHPYQDYISTGGREGKCSLFYVGDGKANSDSPQNLTNSMNLSHSMASTLPTNLSVIPDITINCGFPLTKLKVRPCFERNVLNSLVAMSSMAEDFGVSIYSLARKYIPKYNLSSPSASLGFVWWDDNLIFNIDKDNRINGWYLNNEPTVLDNMPKTVTRWRDIEGNGLLFVDQDRGKYEVDEEMFTNNEELKKPTNHRISISSLNGIAGGGNGGYSNSGMIGSIKKGITQTGLAPFTSERPALNKTAFNFSSKNLPTQSMSNSHSNSFSSHAGSGHLNELVDFKSPYLMTIDLPYVLNSMRISQLPPERKSLYSPEVQAIKESPVKVFKFLAKELEFSCTRESRANDVRSITQLSNGKEDTTKYNPIEKVGISEKTTWTALINRKNEVGETASKKSVSVNGLSESSVESDRASVGNHESNDNKSNSDRQEEGKDGVVEVQEKMEILVELIPICEHNASVYSHIGHLSNFKIWILIRDLLLLDLERLDVEHSDEKLLDTQSTDIDQVGLPVPTGNDESVASDVRSYMTNDLNYFVEEHPKALHADSDEPEQIKRQVDRIQEEDALVEGDVKEQERLRFRTNDDSGSAVLEDDDNEEKFDSHSQVKGIPITPKRQPRRSFFDTYMGALRSPSIGSSVKNEFLMTKFGHSSGRSNSGSRMSRRANSLNNGEYVYLGHKRMSSKTDHPLFLQALRRKGSSRGDFSNNSPMRPLSPMTQRASNSVRPVKNDPPWNSRRLLKQIYKQAVQIGDILLVVNILFLFQNLYQLTSIEVVKNTSAQFIKILHKHELFELSAAILKCSPWEVVINADGGQSLVPIFCEKCGKLITNEASKEKFTLEAQEKGGPLPLQKFGYWYCDSCKKPNTLCVFCEKPIKSLVIVLLECGHEGHFECLKAWFLDEGMVECPGGCMNRISSLIQ